MEQTAIECHTEQEWKDCIIKLGGALNHDINQYRDKEAVSWGMNIEGTRHSCISYYKGAGYNIIQASNFLSGINNSYSIF